MEESQIGSGEQGGESAVRERVRRNPSEIRRVSGIRQSDRRVRLSGKLEKKAGPGALVLSDATGKIDVFFDNLDIADDLEKKYSPGDAILVFGLVIPRGDKFEINGEILAKDEAVGAQIDSALIARAEKVLEK